MSGTVVFWDFDGTIAERPGHWSSCMIDALLRVEPDSILTAESLELYLRHGFPWQDTSIDRTHLIRPDDWWRAIDAVLRAAYLAAGVSVSVVDDAVTGVRPRFRDPDTWRVIPEARTALETLRDAGARQAILSNHVPELPEIVDSLSLGDYFERVFTSAAIGWEKPNAGIFRHALLEFGHPDEVWLIGDNPVADVEGAAGAGIRPILVQGSYIVNDGVTHAEAIRVIRAGTRAHGERVNTR
nr:HAD-IA family hydrolase [Planctomonas sp. JC2975]